MYFNQLWSPYGFSKAKLRTFLIAALIMTRIHFPKNQECERQYKIYAILLLLSHADSCQYRQTLDMNIDWLGKKWLAA